MTFLLYRQIFQIPAFRRFWTGATFSIIGDALTRVALTWYVYELTHSAEALGWLMLCYTGPIVVGGLVAGWLLDRFDRRTVMIADNLIRGCVVALIPLLAATGQLALWYIYTVAALHGLLMMISLAGGPAIIPSLVPTHQLSTANALETLSFTLGGVGGPVVAGLLLASIGAPNVVIIDAVSYFTFALLLMRIPRKPTQRLTTEQSVSGYNIGQAVKLLYSNPILLSTTVMFLIFNIGGGGMLAVWLPILADRLPGGGSELYGILLGVMAVGQAAGAFVGGTLRGSLALGARICIAQALSGLGLGFLLIGQDAWLCAFGLALFGACDAPLTIWAQTLRMRIIPEQLRGRTFALLRMLILSGYPVGGAIAGALLPAVGLSMIVILSACLASIPGLLGYAVRALRQAGQPLDTEHVQTALADQELA